MFSSSDALGVAADFFSLLLSLVDGGFRRLLVDDEQGTQRGAPSFVSSFDSLERKNEGLISGYHSSPVNTRSLHFMRREREKNSSELYGVKVGCYAPPSSPTVESFDVLGFVEGELAVLTLPVRPDISHAYLFVYKHHDDDKNGGDGLDGMSQ